MSSFPPLGPASNAGAYPYRPRPGPSKSLQKLSSGLPVNSGAGASSAPVIPDKLRESIVGASQKPRNAATGQETISYEA